MHWVIQNNLWNEINFETFVNCLQNNNISYEIVKIIPFINEIAKEDNTPNYEWTSSVPTMIIGGTSLIKCGQKKNIVPGIFLNDNFNMKKHNEIWSTDMLNSESLFTTFGELKQPPWSSFFIRPINDDKTFAGHVTNWTDFSIWRKKVIKLKETYTTLNTNTEIMVSEPKNIVQEFRFFIVDEKIITHSLYKLGNKVIYRNDLCSEDLKFFVYQKIWQANKHPARAYVMDVAVLNDGSFKIIEINCINSSGFYACDVFKFIEAIELMKFPSLSNKDDFDEDIKEYTQEQLESF